MIDRLKLVRHENSPVIFHISGFLTRKTLPTFIVNVRKDEAFILDMAGLTAVDDAGAQALVDLSKICRFVVWNAERNVRDCLNGRGINTTFLPEGSI